MSPVVKTTLLLMLSNTFMTFAWYGLLDKMSARPLILAILASWGIAFLEYVFMVPANRIGHQVLTVAQLKMLQEVISLSIFVPFAVLYLREPLNWNYLWAGLCILGAVFFMFRGR
ncbi:MAG: DMT family protein [Deinococcus sp.]|uniref:DMT family protein n=1 Tax=Deinococcus sp. TaxID=47478 RepID=UPI0026DD135B|nr:DMT family protein [Deinococcus sp.]MDO4246913.1 DMT family protein [Deinococcus sp.]